MTYRIARNGQIFGPYTLAEIERYLASGNIVPNDLAQAEGSADWVLVAQLFPSPAGNPTFPGAPPTAAYAYPAPAPAAAAPFAAGQPPSPGGATALYPDPPDLPWWVALLIGLVTGGLFFVAWDIVQAAWLRRVDRASNALWLYIAVAVVYLFRLPHIWYTVDYNVFNGSRIYAHPHGDLFGLAGFVLFIASRYIFRSELLRHFNGPEPIGLRLGGFMTLFGGIYFQYKFNEINRIKRMLHVSVPSV